MARALPISWVSRAIRLCAGVVENAQTAGGMGVAHSSVCGGLGVRAHLAERCFVAATLLAHKYCGGRDYPRSLDWAGSSLSEIPRACSVFEQHFGARGFVSAGRIVEKQFRAVLANRPRVDRGARGGRIVLARVAHALAD